MMDGGINNRLESLKTQVVDDYLRQGRRIRLSTLAVRVLIVASVLIVWEMASGRLLDPFFFTSPSAIVRQTIQWIRSGTLWFHLQFTLLELSLGYLLGSVTALFSAFALGILFFFYEIVEPFVLIAYSIPAIALGPLIIMWLGIDLLPKVLLSYL